MTHLIKHLTTKGPGGDDQINVSPCPNLPNFSCGSVSSDAAPFPRREKTSKDGNGLSTLAN